MKKLNKTLFFVLLLGLIVSSLQQEDPDGGDPVDGGDAG